MHEMWECKSKEEMEKFITGLMKHKEMKEIDTQLQKMVDHTTLTASMWNTVASAKNREKVIEQFSINLFHHYRYPELPLTASTQFSAPSLPTKSSTKEPTYSGESLSLTICLKA